MPPSTKHNVADQRRPSGSIKAVMKNRPTTADTLTKIIRNAAYSGEVPSTSTSKVGPHTPIANPPVWVRPVNIPARHNLGYLNSSIHRVFSTVGRGGGRSISLGS